VEGTGPPTRCVITMRTDGEQSNVRLPRRRSAGLAYENTERAVSSPLRSCVFPSVGLFREETPWAPSAVGHRRMRPGDRGTCTTVLHTRSPGSCPRPIAMGPWAHPRPRPSWR
jgi:hypothetical protein